VTTDKSIGQHMLKCNLGCWI